MGVTLQRALLICLVALGALLPVWLTMEPLLLAMGEASGVSTQPDVTQHVNLII